MKQIIILLLIITSTVCNAQIKLGQHSSETLYFLSHLVDNRSDWQMEKQLYNGEIQELIVYKADQLYYDLKVKVDVIERYIMIDGQYAYNIVHFPSLKTDFLQQRFNDKYSKNKIEALYFTDDYQHYRTIELIDGSASVVYKKYNPNLFSEGINNEVKKRRSEYLANTGNRELTRSKRKSLLFDYFNIKDYDSSFVSRIQPKVIDLIVKQAKNDLQNSISTKSSRSFETLNTSYQVRFYAKSKSKTAQCQIKSLDSTVSYRPSYIYEVMFKLPPIEEQYNGRTYNLNRELVLKLDYDLIRGSIDIKHRKNKPFEILSNKSLSSEFKRKISEQLKKYKSGKFTLYYQFGTINGIDASELLVYDLKK
ncbi:hypothetical protein [Winogradskyella sp. 4-2091]|uniref:hypothetical protein n=1 Tax=Winogradskyella sp. 4-2091 TaxID=3381659 RepID=UPI003891B8AA